MLTQLLVLAQQQATQAWPTILASGGVVIVGACATHFLTRRREHRAKIREAYAEFGGAAFRFLREAEDSMAMTRKAQRLSGERPNSHASKEVFEVHSRILERFMDEQDAALASRMKAVDDLNVARCKLTMLVGGDTALSQDVKDFTERLLVLRWTPTEGTLTAPTDGDPSVLYVHNMKLNLVEWLDSHARRLQEIEIESV